MEGLDILSLGLIGLFLLAVPALFAGFFPFVERSLSLVAVTFGLNSIKGILFWLIVAGVILYLTALPILTSLLRDLGAGSL